ncbi:MAG: PEGA domain-containing protein [Gammaproteobacteria bacterium]|nr:PEGA domain-containing protein [Gammaproteobacteria bacterium]
MTNLEQLKPNQPIEAGSYEVAGQRQQARRWRLSPVHWLLFAVALLCVAFITFITLARSIQVSAVAADLLDSENRIPVAASVEISSTLKLPIGNRTMVLPGDHQVNVTADGYHPQIQSLTVGAERYHQFEVQLRRLPGNLDVVLQPKVPAELMLNGEPFAQLPGLVTDIPPGQHQITIDAPLYRAVSREFLIEGRGQTQSLEVTLQPAWANVSFDSAPVGATIAIDGQKVGTTPLQIQLEEGLHELRISADKYQPIEREFTVTAQQDLVVPSLALLPADGEVEVITDPPEAAVIVDGEYRGVSPMTLTLRPRQDTRLQVYKGGFQLQATSLNVGPGEQRTEQVTLQPDLVNVQFSVSPADAEIIIDGVSRGRGSQTIALTTLPHEIRIGKPGYVSYQNQIIPSKASRQIVSVDLLTKEQYYWANIPDTYQTRAGQTMRLFKSPGKVSMGSSRREPGRRSNEISYTATLKKHFYVSEHEVTNKQFRAFQPAHSAGNYKKKSLDSNKHPAVNVSWQKAALYCNWLSTQEGLDPFYQTTKGFVSGANPDANGYRLLTEVEWAWLARNKSGGVLLYPWGESASPSAAEPVGNFADSSAASLVAFSLSDYNDGYEASAPVGRYPPNHRGIYDMEGNASEWVHDWYGAKGNLEGGKKSNLVDPLGPEIGEFHVVRGGSWAKGHLPQLRLAYRDFGAKGKHDIGFRIARYAGPK